MLSYTNRRNQIYYFKYTTTKNGKFRYYSVRDSKKANLKELPEGFEIYEQPEEAIVVLRKKVQKNITESERQLVEQITKELSACKDVIAEVSGDVLTVYEGRIKAEEFKNIFPPGTTEEKIVEIIIDQQSYIPTMKFTLIDKKKRIFAVERFCYLGGVDDWIFLDESDDLENLAKNFCCHIGRESYYELI